MAAKGLLQACFALVCSTANGATTITSATTDIKK
jgi:hypothetical protein